MAPMSLAFSLALTAHTISVSMSGAQVTAKAQLRGDEVRQMLAACGPGDDMTSLILRDVPRQMRADSVVPRVSCSPGGGQCPLRVFDVAVKPTSRMVKEDDLAAVDDEMQAARRALTEKKRTREAKRVELDVIRRQWSTVETWMDSKVRGGSRGESDGRVVPEEKEVFDMLESTQKKFGEMHTRRAMVEEELASIEVEIDELERKVGGGRHGTHRAANRQNNVYRARDLEIVFSVTEGSLAAVDAEDFLLDLTLDYAVDGVHWKPSYQLSLDAGSETSVIDYYASITSSVGEDWKNVELSLSTGSTSGGGLPVLRPKQIHVRSSNEGVRRKRSSAMRANPMVKMAAFDWPDADDGADAETEEAAFAEEDVQPQDEKHMDVRNTAAATTFVVPRRVNIQSDGTPHRVKVASFDVKSTLRFQCVPSEDNGCWMSTRITNTSTYLLIPGPLVTFIDGQLAYSSRINSSVNPGETFQQVLSKNEGIKAEMKVERSATKSGTGFLSQEKTVENVAKTIEVKNHKGYAVEVDIRDQAPFFFDVSKSDKVSVIVEEPTNDQLSKAVDMDMSNLPCPATVIDDKNIIRWVRAVPPGDTLKLHLKYKVEYKLDSGDTVVHV